MAVEIRASCKKRRCAAKTSLPSLSKPRIIPAHTSIPASWMRRTVSVMLPPTTEGLKLLRFAQRVLIGAFDANEDHADIGCRHQLHQFVIVGEVNRRLGHERQRNPFTRCQSMMTRRTP